MNLGFYYHTPIKKDGNHLLIPGYLAVFINALAKEVDELFLFMHEAINSESVLADYRLENTNITWINLGQKTPAWHRSLLYKKIIKPFADNEHKVDILLIRCPTPLAPYFNHLPALSGKIAFMIVGDYGDGANHMTIQNIRDLAIRIYLKWIDKVLSKAVCGKLILVNSNSLFTKYKTFSPNIHLIKTTTLKESDFWQRKNNSLSHPIRLAYIGRFDFQKGLNELFAAAAILRNKINIQLHLTGWEDSANKPVEISLKKKADDLGISQYIFWHGRKKTGEELNQMYRNADIYILPSYHEGFPRTIWEAMANSCPVIATKVGSIPAYLEHEKHALLIESKSAGAIEEAIVRVINDEPLRKRLIQNGFELAKENTLEIQTKKLVEILENSFQNA